MKREKVSQLAGLLVRRCLSLFISILFEKYANVLYGLEAVAYPSRHSAVVAGVVLPVKTTFHSPVEVLIKLQYSALRKKAQVICAVDRVEIMCLSSIQEGRRISDRTKTSAT